MTTNFSQPALPPLYFLDRTVSRFEHNTNKNDKYEKKNNNNSPPELPAELMKECLTSFATWGDLAKLACVQKSWSTIITDTAEYNGIESKWELAQALLIGECGLQKNASRAIRILKELANLKPATTTTAQDTTTNSLERDDKDKDCFAPAMKLIAKCYFNGDGVEQDSETGLAWLRASYEIGNDETAAHEMAVTYEYGNHGVAVDVVAAFEWFKKSAEDGHVEAMSELALCYELGCGVEQDDELALDWYSKAAEKGHVTAKFSVGEIFEEARGVPQSDEEACLWYYRAALMGDEDSKIALRRLYDIARIRFPGVGAILNE